MFSVTNRILVKKGMGYNMAPYFTADQTLVKWEGFNKVEVHVCSDHEEYDELNVLMYWNTLAQFEVWRASDDFKAAHQRIQLDGEQSPIIKSETIISEVVSILK